MGGMRKKSFAGPHVSTSNTQIIPENAPRNAIIGILGPKMRLRISKWWVKNTCNLTALDFRRLKVRTRNLADRVSVTQT